MTTPASWLCTKKILEDGKILYNYFLFILGNYEQLLNNLTMDNFWLKVW